MIHSTVCVHLYLTIVAPLCGLILTSFPSSFSWRTSNPFTAPGLLPRSLNFLKCDRALRCSTLPGSNNENAAFRSASPADIGNIACDESKCNIECVHRFTKEYSEILNYAMVVSMEYMYMHGWGMYTFN